MLKIIVLISLLALYESSNKCKTVLLQSYNLDPLDEPSDTVFLDMCPTLNLSCCKIEAQNQIYIWMNKQKEVNEFYTIQENLYSKVLETFDKVTVIAKKILEL